MNLFQRSLWIGFGLVLFLYFWGSLLLASQGKKLWTDETDGWSAVQSLSISDLFVSGAPQGQASRSPMAYIVDRAVMKTANDHPLSFWDLRLFYRIPCTFFWALACTFLFFYLSRKLFLLMPDKKPSVVFLFALTGAFFVFTNSFSIYYAIEARSYSLWTALTLIQTCFLWSILTEKMNRWNFSGFLIANYLLVFATYASSLQVGLASGIILLHHFWLRKKIFPLDETQGWVIATLIGSAAITLYYYSKIAQMNFTPFPFYDYLMSVNEVILKSFRHHGSQPAWVSYPLLFIVVPLYWWKKHRGTAYLALSAHASILLTYLHYRASLAAGGLYASRYAAFLTPSLSFLYALGIFTALLALSGLIKKRTRKDTLIPLLVIFCLVNLLPWVMKHSKGIPTDIARFQWRNSYLENTDPKCLEPLNPDPEKLEAQNSFCRKL